MIACNAPVPFNFQTIFHMLLFVRIRNNEIVCWFFSFSIYTHTTQFNDFVNFLLLKKKLFDPCMWTTKLVIYFNWKWTALFFSGKKNTRNKIAPVREIGWKEGISDNSHCKFSIEFSVFTKINSNGTMREMASKKKSQKHIEWWKSGAHAKNENTPLWF